MRQRKAQFAIEFIALLAFMFIIFLAFTSILSSRILEARENERQQAAEDIASMAKNEIELASGVSDGYIRVFNLPNKVRGTGYNITIIDQRELVVNYIDKEYVTFLPDSVSGNLVPGTNSIRKNSGIVFINS